MAAFTPDWYRKRVVELLKPANAMIDMKDATVSIGLEQNVNQQGAWVQLWVWVPDPPLKETERDVLCVDD